VSSLLTQQQQQAKLGVGITIQTSPEEINEQQATGTLPTVSIPF